MEVKCEWCQHSKHAAEHTSEVNRTWLVKELVTVPSIRVNAQSSEVVIVTPEFVASAVPPDST